MAQYVQRQACKIAIFVIVILAICPGGLSAASKDTSTERVPEVIVSLETETGHSYAILIEKNTQRLFLYDAEDGYRRLYRMSCSTGEAEGPKQFSGDKKTPEGVYFFTQEHEDRYLAPVYGSRAFPMDYPNVVDRIAGREGNSIWMHGTNKPLKAKDSNGCIVLENRDINKLAKYITLNRTPIVIVDKISYVSTDSVAKEKTAIHNFLFQWNDAIEKGTYHDYLQYYDADYVPDISWWTEWNHIRRKLQTASVPFSVQIQNISILKHDSTYTVLFDQGVESSGKTSLAGTRKLYLVRRGGAGAYRISGEEYQVLPDEEKGKVHENPLVALCRQLAGTAEKSAPEIARKRPISKAESSGKKQRIEDEIVNMVDGWLNAWSSKDIKRYGNYYAKDFRSQGGADIQKWLKYKEKVNRKYDFIRVSRKNLKIKPDKHRCIVTFVQTYTSDQYKAVGLKRLILKKEGKQWKIYREIWKKI